MRSDCLIGPYFFDEAVKATPYSTMLETELLDRGHMDVVWLQHDRPQAHRYLCTRRFECFPGRWTGSGSSKSLAPLTWPPRSFDPTTPRNSLRCGIKRRAVRCLCTTNEEISRVVGDFFENITPPMIRGLSQGI